MVFKLGRVEDLEMLMWRIILSIRICGSIILTYGVCNSN
jgi:hypothetical protein